MKKTLLSIMLVMLGAGTLMAQTKINQTFDVKSVDELDLIFEYPELVQIKVWDGKEVKVEGTVNIQNGEFDEDFEIKGSSGNGKFTIESSIRNLKKRRGNHSVYTYSDDDDDENTSVTVSSKGTTINVGSRKNRTFRNGINISIELVVTIPRNMKVVLNARYGLVEVLENPKALEIDARYGGVDVRIDEAGSLEFDASTQWGQIFTNLDVPIKMGGNDSMGKWMRARASLKKGDNRLSIESQYGNVYLRKN